MIENRGDFFDIINDAAQEMICVILEEELDVFISNYVKKIPNYITSKKHFNYLVANGMHFIQDCFSEHTQKKLYEIEQKCAAEVYQKTQMILDKY